MFVMAHASYLREKARAMRIERRLTIDELAERIWRSRHRVLTVRVQDTRLRARLQAWMDRLREEWR
jgi:hypothetical protein